MPMSIEEQLAILKAYSEGKPVYMRKTFEAVGKQVEPEGHIFDFKSNFYSVSPLDWCTGKDAVTAYATLLLNGTENDMLHTSRVYSEREDDYTHEKLTYHTDSLNLVDAYPLFIAGAEWVLKNLDNGIDFQESLEKLRENCIERQRTEDEARRRALHIQY